MIRSFFSRPIRASVACTGRPWLGVRAHVVSAHRPSSMPPSTAAAAAAATTARVPSRAFATVPQAAADDVTITEWVDGKDSIPEVLAYPREKKGKNFAASTRKDSNFSRIPAIVKTLEFKDTRKNEALYRKILVDPAVLNRQLKKGKLYNTVFNLKIEGDDPPTPVLVSQYNTDTVTYQPMSYVFYKHLPSKRVKVKLPILFDNEEDAMVIKKGGFLLHSTMYAQCYWRGDHRIPRSVNVDALNTRVGMVYKLTESAMVENLSLQHPERGPVVLGSTVGGRGAKDVDEE